jgi:hypothetical protein
MYCPHCGQQQIGSEVRYCPRCGFPMGGVTGLLATGGVPATPAPVVHGKALSPRQRGIRQGAMLMLSTMVVVPVIIFLFVMMFGMRKELIPLVAATLFMGGLLRILYALLMEDNTPEASQQSAPLYSAPVAASQVSGNTRGNALPPAQSIPAQARREHANTAEMVRPSSVTEGTTRLLDDQHDTRT